MNKFLYCLIVLSFSSPVFADSKIFKEIADEAQIGNGDSTLGTYNKSIDKKALVKQGLAEMKQDYWENCGPWKTISDRRPALKKIEELESMQDTTSIAKKLTALYEAGKITAIVGAISNENVECSLSWFQIYGTDGSVLKLHYNLGD